MNPYDNLTDDDRNYDSIDDESDEDRSLLYNTTHCTGISRDYVASWGSTHAVREFYQNWLALIDPKL